MSFKSMKNVVPFVTPVEPIQQGKWASLLPEFVLDLIRWVEESETFWLARAVEPQQCGRITFPISFNQPGPRDYPMQCYIRRNKTTSTFLLYLAKESNKLLLAAKRKENGDFVISLDANDFSQASNKCVGKVRSNIWGNKFSVYDNQPPYDAEDQPNFPSSGIFNSHKVSPRNVPTCNHLVSTISKVLSTPRRINCIMKSIPVSAIQEEGNSPKLTSLPPVFDETFSPSPTLKGKTQMRDSYSASLSELSRLNEPLTLKNKAPIWDERCKGWYLDFKGRVTVASVKNFQFVAVVDPSHNDSPEEQERVILQFGKIGEDIFTMDYSYPLSAFQAFAICLTSAFAAF